MAGKFHWKLFSEIDLADPFFDSLKADYPGTENSSEFGVWFQKKARTSEQALVYEDEYGIGAFVAIKPEAESIELSNGAILPAIERVKICTIKIGERHQGQRLGEGAIGLALWKWKDIRRDQVYVTAFDKHTSLIAMLEKYGFRKIGYNKNGEGFYLKDRKLLDYSTPYKSFPFINPDFDYGGYLIIDDSYHDTMFPYSELKNTLQESVDLNVANGVCKAYVGHPLSMPYYIGEPIFIYRKYNQGVGKRYKSCITSYCVITDIYQPRIAGKATMTFEEMMARIRNKSVYSEAELRTKYMTSSRMTVIEMLYYGFFGEGNNKNMDWLDNNGYWCTNVPYPTEEKLSVQQFKEILSEANVDVQNVIID